MANKSKWVVYEFRDGQHVIIGKPQASREDAEKLRDKLTPQGRGKRSLGVGRLS